MMRRTFWFVVMYATVITLWWGIYHFHLVSPAVLPSPGEVARALPTAVLPTNQMNWLYGPDGLWKDEYPQTPRSLGPDFVYTVYRAAIAYFIGVPLGVGFGFLIFYSGPLAPPGEYLMDFLRSIPASALVPLFLVFFGIGDLNKIAVGAFSAGLVVCLATIQGLRARNPTRQALMSHLKLSLVKRLRFVDVPEIMPHLFIGLRTGISLALILVVVSEMMIGTRVGIGKAVKDLYDTDGKPQLFVVLVGAGTIGYVFNLGLKSVESALVKWNKVRP